jgi:hypothetical protein
LPEKARHGDAPRLAAHGRREELAVMTTGGCCSEVLGVFVVVLLGFGL